MPSTMPLRVGDDLLASARIAADAAGRSTAQQIGHWAKLGRELERSGSLPVREIAEVLAGARSYDDLDAKAQAIVRAEWDARIEARRAALNLAEAFAAEGRSWVEMGPDGAIVRHPAAAEKTAAKKATAKKVRAKKTAAKKVPAKKTAVAKKVPAKKVPAKKTAKKALASAR